MSTTANSQAVDRRRICPQITKLTRSARQLWFQTLKERDLALDRGAIVDNAFRQSLATERDANTRDGMDAFDQRMAIEAVQEIPVEFGDATETTIGIRQQHQNTGEAASQAASLKRNVVIRSKQAKISVHFTRPTT